MCQFKKKCSKKIRPAAPSQKYTKLNRQPATGTRRPTPPHRMDPEIYFLLKTLKTPLFAPQAQNGANLTQNPGDPKIDFFSKI